MRTAVLKTALRFIVFTPYYNLCRNGDIKSNVFVTFCYHIVTNSSNRRKGKID